MKEIASQIVADGVGHFSRFREMQVLLSPFSKRLQAGGLPVYLRPVVPADAGSANAERSLALYKSLIEELARAYASGDAEDAGHVIAARQHMMELDTLAEDMARGGAGIPFF